MRRYAATILLSLTLFIGEVHTYWEGRPLRPQNWIWKVSREMPLQWNIKLASVQLNMILIFLAFLLYVPNRVNKATAVTFFWFAVLDTVLYFYNYKTFGYGYLYLVLAVIWLMAYFWHKNSTGVR